MRRARYYCGGSALRRTIRVRADRWWKRDGKGRLAGNPTTVAVDGQRPSDTMMGESTPQRKGGQTAQGTRNVGPAIRRARSTIWDCSTMSNHAAKWNAIMTNHPISVGSATLLVAILIGCGSEQDARFDAANQDVAPSTMAGPHVGREAPFEYKLISKEEMTHTWGPQVVVKLETTTEVAKKATKDDLRELWQQMAPTLGDHRVFLYIETPIPGASPWAVISRINMDGTWKVDITIYEYAIDAEPHYFVNQIDRSVEFQSAMIVTLPMLNRLNEQLVRRGWNVEHRQEDFYSARWKEGIQSASVTVMPEGIDLNVLLADGNTFPDTVDIVFAELGIADEVKKNLYSVIGSPKYMRVAPGEPAQWSWTIDGIEVTYLRLPKIDQLMSEYAR